ncbi:MAG: hypothetical protein ACYTHM_04215 [Planctomycetota bacterium]|jgi:hypothetical protein
MSIALEFTNVILLKSSIAKKFTNGLRGFLAKHKAYKILADDHLIAVSFMSTIDARAFTFDLTPHGIETDVDFTILEPSQDPQVSWLEAGMQSGILACWLKGELPGEVVKSIDYDMFFIEGLHNFVAFFKSIRKRGYGTKAETRGPGKVLSKKQLVIWKGEDRIVLEYYKTDLGNSFIIAMYPESVVTQPETLNELSQILGDICM